MNVTIIDVHGVPHDSILATLDDKEALLARLAGLRPELKHLRALFGGNGYVGERDFKLIEARVDLAIRAKMEREFAEDQEIEEKKDRKGVSKPTEPAIDARVRTSDDYVTAFTQHLAQKDRWVDLELELNEIEWRLRIRYGDAHLLAQEMRSYSYGPDTNP